MGLGVPRLGFGHAGLTVRDVLASRARAEYIHDFAHSIREQWTLGLNNRTTFSANGDSQDHTFGFRLDIKF